MSEGAALRIEQRAGVNFRAGQGSPAPHCTAAVKNQQNIGSKTQGSKK